MGIEQIRAQRDQYLENEGPDSVKARVMGVFLSQPNQVGPHAGALRLINLRDSGDYNMFTKSAERAKDRIKQEIEPQKHILVEETFREGLSMLLK
jgi:hypothetical protein